MSLTLPACPPSLKSIQHFLKIATEHETRDPVITYWARLTALQNGLAIDKSTKVFPSSCLTICHLTLLTVGSPGCVVTTDGLAGEGETRQERS